MKEKTSIDGRCALMPKKIAQIVDEFGFAVVHNFWNNSSPLNIDDHQFSPVSGDNSIKASRIRSSNKVAKNVERIVTQGLPNSRTVSGELSLVAEPGRPGIAPFFINSLHKGEIFQPDGYKWPLNEQGLNECCQKKPLLAMILPHDKNMKFIVVPFSHRIALELYSFGKDHGAQALKQFSSQYNSAELRRFWWFALTRVLQSRFSSYTGEDSMLQARVVELNPSDALFIHGQTLRAGSGETGLYLQAYIIHRDTVDKIAAFYFWVMCANFCYSQALCLQRCPVRDNSTVTLCLLQCLIVCGGCLESCIRYHPSSISTLTVRYQPSSFTYVE
jgi:hypothetical protein